jgi:phospholipid-binding lipoprotein MlaA
MQMKKLIAQLGCLACSGVLAGCTISAKDARDPLEGWNRGVQTLNDHLDKYAIRRINTSRSLMKALTRIIWPRLIRTNL